MFDIPTLLVLIPALPLSATLVTALMGKRLLREQSHWPTVLAIGMACAASIALLVQIYRSSPHGAERAAAEMGYERVFTLWTWADVQRAYGPVAAAGEHRDFRVDVAMRADPLTAVMLAMVTFISLLVAVYSVGYMHGDPGYWRFFTYISLFVFSMTMLVSVSNFLLLYVFWEAVGLCSYLLIGFWFEKPAAAAAGMKAFLVNRVGDFGFALGVFLIWITYGTLNFHDTAESVGVLGRLRLYGGPAEFAGGTVGLMICLLLLLGACGKSAQFPLHVWLPDAMEGPTPVSALIHAATMVTAGVYMVMRCAPLYLASIEGQHAVAIIGGITAALAAVIAVTQTDLKRILAYSTISQLGYMFIGLGTGTAFGLVAGMFHLFTHAFFKALLFLGAGSVMHAMGGVIDITRFGGLRRRMPVTYATFLVGALALGGIPPLAGFFSKDEILAAIQAGDHPLYDVLFVVAVGAALLTVFYTFRAFFLTFHGEELIPHEAGHHAHESPATMTVPLVILACCSAVVGLWLWWTGDFADFLAATPSLAYVHRHFPAHAHGDGHAALMAISLAIGVAGIFLAWLLYLAAPALASSLTATMSRLGLYQLSFGRFFIDQIYNLFVVWPLEALSFISYWIDAWLVDGLVNAVGRAPPAVGSLLRPLQGGLVQFYAMAMVLGLLALAGALLL
jgi:NADH-quinone oxidoreductase subunit L